MPGYTPVYFSATDSPAQVMASLANAINAVYYDVDPTSLHAIPIPYTSGGGTLAPPATIALANFTAAQGFYFFSTMLTATGITVTGTAGVTAGRQRIAVDASETANRVALAIQAAIVASNAYIASKVSVSGSVIAINDPLASIAGTRQITQRLTGRLAIDPGVIVKFNGSRIEAQIGATLIAEGTAVTPTILTSIEDDRYRRGRNLRSYERRLPDDNHQPSPAGRLERHSGRPRLNRQHRPRRRCLRWRRFEHRGRLCRLQRHRLAARRSCASPTASSSTTTTATTLGYDVDRAGRGFNGPATIYVRGAQPVIVGNTFLNNDNERGSASNDTSPVVSIDVDSLNSSLVPDWGRSSGPLDAFTQYAGNFGPLVRGNILQNNGLNGMLVRSGVVALQSVWDDTDIVHIVGGEISSPNSQTYSGIRLQSNDQGSLVVKLLGATAGFTAAGRTLDMTDRIGGSVQIVGRPGYPVVLTSLYDNTVGAGMDLSGNSQNDTANNPTGVGSGGRLAQRRTRSIQQRSQRRRGQRTGSCVRRRRPSEWVSRRQRHGQVGPISRPVGHVHCGRRRHPSIRFRTPRRHPLRQFRGRRYLQFHRYGRHGGLVCHGTDFVRLGLGARTD